MFIAGHYKSLDTVVTTIVLRLFFLCVMILISDTIFISGTNFPKHNSGGTYGKIFKLNPF